MSHSAVVPVGDRAAELGHLVAVEHAANRFRLRCSCGFVTPRSATRKAAFQAITDHVYEVVRDGVSVPGSDGRRL